MRFSERTQKLALGDGITTVLYWRDAVYGYGYLIRRSGEDKCARYYRKRADCVDAIKRESRIYGGVL